MLKHPSQIGLPTFEVSDRKREITRFNRPGFTLAPHAHDASGRRAHVFPVAPAHRICIDFSQVWLGGPGQLCQRLGIDFGAHDPSNLHRG